MKKPHGIGWDNPFVRQTVPLSFGHPPQKKQSENKNNDANPDDNFVATLSHAICHELHPGSLSLVVCNYLENTAHPVYFFPLVSKLKIAQFL